VQHYRTLAEAHILSAANRLDRLYGELLRTGCKVKPGKPPAGLSPTTVHAVTVSVSAMLSHAVKKEHLVAQRRSKDRADTARGDGAGDLDRRRDAALP
jgi:hypothetical protein